MPEGRNHAGDPVPASSVEVDIDNSAENENDIDIDIDITVNDGDGDNGEEKKVDICHEGQTINVAESAADDHLREHPGDTLGKCPDAVETDPVTDTVETVDVSAEETTVAPAEPPPVESSSEPEVL